MSASELTSKEKAQKLLDELKSAAKLEMGLHGTISMDEGIELLSKPSTMRFGDKIELIGAMLPNNEKEMPVKIIIVQALIEDRNRLFEALDHISWNVKSCRAGDGDNRTWKQCAYDAESGAEKALEESWARLAELGEKK